MTQKEYEELREKVIRKYGILYKDSLSMDACEVPKETRLRLFEDAYYISKTKALKAGLFAEQLETINTIISGTYAEEGKDNSPVILKAVEMKNKLLLEDLNVTRDDSNAVNVVFMGMDEDTFRGMDTVEIHEGSNSELGADFTADDGSGSSFEDRMKAEVKKKMEELESKEKED